MSTDPQRARARRLAEEGLARGDAVGWFEELYAEAATGQAVVPWADLEPNPMLLAWLAREDIAPTKVLEAGCGYGDNSAALAAAGHEVLAFDVSEAAVKHARERFSDAATFEVADARSLPEAWHRAFSLVVEVYTLQALPRPEREQVGQQLARCVAPGGKLLVIARLRDEHEAEGTMPWPLTRPEIEALAIDGLTLSSFEDFLDDEDPPVRRLRAVLERA